MTALKVGAKVDVAKLGLPGTWSIWSQAGECPGGYFVAPSDDEALALGVKYAVIKAVMGRSRSAPDLALVRTDPPRTDLVAADEARRKKEKRS